MTVDPTKTVIDTTPAPDSTTVLAKLGAWFKKSVSEASLRDIEQIVSGIDDHEQSHAMPTKEETDTGPAQAMRGGQANTQVMAHSNVLPQEGLTAAYDRFNTMMTEMQKSLKQDIGSFKKDISAIAGVVKGIVDSMASAVKSEKDTLDKTREEMDSAEDEAKKAATLHKAKDDKLALVFRKARIAVRKAEADDDEEEDDWKDKMEKAQSAIVALSDHISKAEDEAEDDTDEKRTEKARTDLRALKVALKKCADLRAKKSATVVAPAVQAPAQTPAVATADLTAALDQWATQKGITVPQLFAQLGVKTSEPVVEPPTFAKAIAENALTMDIIDQRIEDATDACILKDNEIAKADTLRGRLAAARVGKYDLEALAHEIQLSTPNVQSLFVLPKAA